jgi:hypothetical protein
MTSTPRDAPRGWWLLFIAATAIAAYGASFQFTGLDGFQGALLESFAERPWAVWFHVIFGALALVTGALNFRHGLRRRWPRVHHRIGEAYLIAALLTGLAGGWLAVFAYGGVANRFGFGGLALALLATTTMAYVAVRERRFHAHRDWMIRSYATILAAVSLRLQLPLLSMAFGQFEPAYAIVAWSCWLPNLLAAEWIVRRDPTPPL